MKISSWFLKLALLAFCLKFLLNGLLVTFIIALVLGFQSEENKSMHSFGIGLLLGFESAVIAAFTTPFDLFAQLLGILKNLNVPILDPFAYASVQVFAFAILLIFEMLFFIIITTLFSYVAKLLQSKGYFVQW